MSFNQSQVDIANLSLLRLGQRKIQSITDQSDANAIACNVGWNQALGEVSREAPWNCLKKRMALVQLAPAPDSPAANPDIPPSATAWAPATNYAVNAYVTFGVPAYLYQCLIANTSSASFTQDLIAGYWFQTTIFSPNYINGPGNASRLYEWNYAYQLPDDFVMLIELNGQNCWNSGDVGSLYEIYEQVLYCDASSADIKYNRVEMDTTKYDTLFTGALVMNLAAIIATTLRKDDAELSMRMLQLYQRYITRARVMNAGENNPRRYNIVSQSRFVRSRRWSTNG